MNHSARQDSQTEMSHSGIPKNKTKLEFTEKIQFCLRMPCVERHKDSCACWWNYNENQFGNILLKSWFSENFIQCILITFSAPPSSSPLYTHTSNQAQSVLSIPYTLGCVAIRWSTLALSRATPLRENGLSLFQNLSVTAITQGQELLFTSPWELCQLRKVLINLIMVVIS